MTLTLRDIPPDLDAALRKKADSERRPLDQVALETMKVGLGLARRDPGSDGNKSLAASIRARFGALGGIELAEPIRAPIPEPRGPGQ
jgi:hypothetical protein